MTTALTPEQAAMQVAMIRRDRHDARVIGIHASCQDTFAKSPSSLSFIRGAR